MKTVTVLTRILTIFLIKIDQIDFLIMTMNLGLLKLPQQNIPKETLQQTTYSLQI